MPEPLENQGSIVRAKLFCTGSRTGADGLALSQQAHSSKGSKRGLGVLGRRGRQELAEDTLAGAAAVPTGTFARSGCCSLPDPSTELSLYLLCVDYHGQSCVFV